MKEKVVLAIDIGGSFTKVGLVTREGTILGKTVYNTEARQPFSHFMKKLKSVVEILISKKYSDIDVRCIGVGAPNANPYTGQIEHPPNLSWGPSTPLTKILKDTFKLPVFSGQ